MLLGLTGSPGAGKSLVARYLGEMGAVIISGDEAGRKVLQRYPEVMRRLERIFGPHIVKADGSLDRRKLGMIVFSNREAMRIFDEIMHPPLLKILKAEIENHLKKRRRLIVVDAALIFEWGIEGWFDYILVVSSLREKRIERMRLSGLTVKEAKDRIRSQFTQSKKAAGADFVLENNGSRAALKKKVYDFMRESGINQG